MAHGINTSLGGPRAQLLQHSVSKGQSAAHMHPLSFVRPALHGPPVGNIMSVHGLPLKGKTNNQAQAALLALVMHLMNAQRGNTGGG